MNVNFGLIMLIGLVILLSACAAPKSYPEYRLARIQTENEQIKARLETIEKAIRALDEELETIREKVKTKVD